jgi:uncharacterized membrane protein
MSNLPDDPVTRAGSAGASNANIVYILYLVGLLVGVTPIVGVIMAYVNRDGAEPWLRTHYDFQIRTFWIGVLYAVVGSILMLVLVGFLILAFALIWYIVRCVKGMSALGRNEPIADPTSWMFG